MIRSGLTLRPASISDAEQLRRWRNDLSTRSASGTTHEVHPDEHERWLRAKLEAPTGTLMIVEENGRPIGQARLDLQEPHAAAVSISLDRSRRGRGLSRQVLLAVIERARAMTGVDQLVAQIRVENEVSRRSFASVGFTESEVAAAPSRPVDGFSTFTLDLREGVTGDCQNGR